MENITQEQFTQIVENCHNQLFKFPDIKKYLNDRLITDELIKDFELGYGEFYGSRWITIPVKDIKGEYALIKLRKDPQDNKNPNKFMFYPIGGEGTLYGAECFLSGDTIILNEGEMDRILLMSRGVPAVTSTVGAVGFKKDWICAFKNIKKVYICFDRDEAGDKGAERVGQMILEEWNDIKVFKCVLPEVVGKGGDITDYLMKTDGDIDKLLYEMSYPIIAKEKKEKKYREYTNANSGNGEYTNANFGDGEITKENIEMARNTDCGSFLKIVRTGAGVSWALCPFHNEKTPSLACYEGERGFFCYGCSAGGDAIDLVRELYKLNFVEAVKFIIKK